MSIIAHLSLVPAHAHEFHRLHGLKVPLVSRVPLDHTGPAAALLVAGVLGLQHSPGRYRYRYRVQGTG